MKKSKSIQRIHLGIILSVIFSINCYPQVGIGTDNPNPNAILDVSTDQGEGGLLIPRVALSGANSNQIGKVKGMIVYNTTDAGAGSNEVKEGYYFHNGSVWVRMIDQSGNWWSTKGNNIDANNHFLGTTGGQPLVVKVNNAERLRIRNDGKILINKENPGSSLTSMLAVAATGNNTAISGEAENGTAIYGITRKGHGIHGVTSHRDGVGVWAENTDEDGIGIVAYSGTMENREGGSGGIFSGNEYGGIGYGGNAGLVGLGNGITAVPSRNNVGVIGAGEVGVYGFGNAGVIGIGNNRSGGVDAPTLSAGIIGNANYYGVYGRSYATSGDRAGGYFVNYGNTNVPNRAWVAATIEWEGVVEDFKIVGDGQVSTLVRGINNEDLIMVAPEAPEALFQDFGEAKLTNGTAQVILDPNFTKNINVGPQTPLRVFVQLEDGECNGVYVSEKSAQGFTVRELQNGTCNGTFSWEVVAKRANEIQTQPNGEVRIVDYSRRFPPLPESFKNPSKLIQQEKTKEIKASYSEEE